MSGIDPIPAPDAEFDTLQKQIVTKVTANAVAWGIPAGDVTDLTDAQTPWTTTWAIAQFKTTTTQAQREAKDLARKNYEKFLRPFIQKWIYRNSAMDDAAVEECGLRPRDTTRTPAPAPLAPVATVNRGTNLQLLAECAAVEFAEFYGCILTEAQPLGAKLTLTPEGKIILNPVAGAILGFQMDITKQRKKKFNGLKQGVTYYIYFYAVNAAGASPLSDPVNIVCW